MAIKTPTSEFHRSNYPINKIHKEYPDREVLRTTPNMANYITINGGEILFPDDNAVEIKDVVEIYHKLRTYEHVASRNQLLVKWGVFILYPIKTKKYP